MRPLLKLLLLLCAASVTAGAPLARTLPAPYDAAGQVQMLEEILREDGRRYELQVIDLFEDDRPYAPRANSTMLSDVRRIFRAPEGAPFEREGALLRARLGEATSFERALFLHSSFELPGQQSYWLQPAEPILVRGKLLRASLWVHSDMYRHRLWLLFRTASGREVRADAGPLLWRGWRRLDVGLPAELQRRGRRQERPYDHQFTGFLIESSPHSDAGDFALMIDNALVLADLEELRYPGTELLDVWD